MTHHVPGGSGSVMRWWSVPILAVALLVTGCAASSATSAPITPAPPEALATTAPVATQSPTPSPTPAGPFVSSLYGYVVDLPGWTGYAATTAWDGTGAPGNGDPFVDLLTGPHIQAFVAGAPTKDKLDQYVDAMRKVNATVHECPIKPETKTTITIDGAPGRLDSDHCPAVGGVFAMSATVVRDGRAYIFSTFGTPDAEATIRSEFDDFLKGVSFAS
jgi:hypothetical protein